jgi:hypothetical protein
MKKQKTILSTMSLEKQTRMSVRIQFRKIKKINQAPAAVITILIIAITILFNDTINNNKNKPSTTKILYLL